VSTVDAAIASIAISMAAVATPVAEKRFGVSNWFMKIDPV
jgi:hypothetical protein